MSCYDEFALLQEQAAELGLPWDRPPAVRREFVEVAPDRRLGALVWGRQPAELVLLHGGAQNAHTWDSVALLLGRPLMAVDLPGHGHSDWRLDRDYTPRDNAADVATAVRSLAPEARLVAGMSLGGVTAIALMAAYPELVRRLVLVDVTPGSNAIDARPIATFVRGAPRRATFEQLLEYATAALPEPRPASIRRGLLHNAKADEHGSWTWRHHLGSFDEEEVLSVADSFPPLWHCLAQGRVPLMLVRGGRSPAVSAADVFQLREIRPDARIEVVEDAGHSIQGDQPRRLAELLEQFLAQ